MSDSETTSNGLVLQAQERIEEMESNDYAFPQPFGRADWVMAGLVITAMTIWLIAGIWM